jgi:hypothetical protein
VAAELLRRGHQVAITMGNAKSVDLFVQNRAGETFSVQVKTLRQPNAFIISPERVAKDRVYAFVILNDVSKAPTFFFVHGRELSERKERFWTRPGEKLAGFGPRALEAYRDAWGIFEGRQ